MALHPVAGTKIDIGGVLSDKAEDFIESDFALQSFIEIDGFSNMGSLGDNAQLISTNLINRKRVVKQKGTFNGGSMSCTFAIVSDDPGQLVLRAAATSTASYAFRLRFEDGAVTYFIALVMGTSEAGGEANTIRNLSATLEINSNLVEVPAP